ncbi:MAG TPA: TRAP transporter permease [Pseudogracilibacillus sp.]|nr:TRAP transporter permease [Pseudogracilibacillus sp.]
MSEDKGNQEITSEEQQELMEKYDTESNTRNLTGWIAAVVFVILLSFSLFQLYTGIFGMYTAYIQRSIHLGFALSLVFLLYPAWKKGKKKKVVWYDYILALASIAVAAYWPLFYDQVVQRFGGITDIEVVIGAFAILLVLEATRRSVGLPIVIISILFILYALYGPQMPGILAHRGLTMNQLIKTMYFSTDGILGTPLGVSAKYIFLFLLFGAFLIQTNIGNYFNELALSLTGTRVGGPAKVAIFSSALNGTISGSSVANTVTTGSYTIPMMKNLGYRSNFAGAVEAASSTGGQIMPPIMGAAAFLMIEFAGVDYWTIAKAAIIPAILYFTGIWIMTHFEAKRIGLYGLPKDELPKKATVIKKLYLLIPIIAIIWFLFKGVSVGLAAIYGMAIIVLVSLILKETRITPRKFIDALTTGARTALGVASATACAGIIVGVITKTGLGLTLGNQLVSLAGTIVSTPQLQLLLTLFFTMITSIIIGMGSPTTANYIITSTIALPAILALNEQLGASIPELAGHMFVFYFGIVADITPPVALAAFAATGISGGDPIKTGGNASRLAIGAFIIPYMFVLQPELLMIDAHLWEVLLSAGTAIIGMIAIGGGLIGFWYRKIHWIERIIAVATGLLLMYPGLTSDLIGLVLFIALIVFQFMVKGIGSGRKLQENG